MSGKKLGTELLKGQNVQEQHNLQVLGPRLGVSGIHTGHVVLLRVTISSPIFELRTQALGKVTSHAQGRGQLQGRSER